MKSYCCQFKKEHKKESKKLKKYFKNINTVFEAEEYLAIINKILINKRELEIKEYTKNFFEKEEIPKDLFTYNTLSNNIPCSNCFKYYTEKTYEEQLQEDERLEEKHRLYTPETEIKTKKEEVTKEDNVKEQKFYSLKELIKETKKEVIGQMDLIKKMATIFYMHELKVKGKINTKKSITPLIAGATGTGKTMIAEVMSKLINVPFVSFSSITFTEDGWEGADLFTYLAPHVKKDNFEHSIVFIDEFDKILKGNEHQLNYYRIKQYRLLTFIQGEDISRLKQNINSSSFQIILAGAFRDFIVSNGIGFHGDVDKSKKKNFSISKDDIVNLGVAEELAGRITDVYNTRDLELQDYIDILKDSENNYLHYYEEVIQTLGLNMKYSDQFINSIAQKAHDSNFGARDLNNYLFEYFQPLILEFSDFEKENDEYIDKDNLIHFEITDNIENDIKSINEKISLINKNKEDKAKKKKAS